MRDYGNNGALQMQQTLLMHQMAAEAKQLTQQKSETENKSSNNIRTFPYKGRIQIYEAAEVKGEVPGGYSKSVEAFKIGDYDMLPNYITNEKGEEVLSHYTASIIVDRVKSSGGIEKVARIDYVLGISDLEIFKSNVKVFAGAANLLFSANLHLEEWQLDLLNNNGGYIGFIADQFKSPVAWISILSEFVVWSRSFKYTELVSKGGNTVRKAIGYNKEFSFNTSHGFNRMHPNGKSFAGLNITITDLESKIAFHAYKNLDKIPSTYQVMNGAKAFEGSFTSNKILIGYRAVTHNGIINITTYWPK